MERMSVGELDDLMDRVKSEMKNKKYHSYFRMYVCYARKPEAAEESRPSSRGSTIRLPAYDFSGGETDCASIIEEREEEEEEYGDDTETEEHTSQPAQSIYHGRRRHRGH